MTTAPALAQTTNLATIVTPGINPPVGEILQPGDLERHAASLKPEELLAHLKTAFSGVRDTLRHNLPYLLEARNRFAKPGQRLPVEGNPTWTQWVRDNLHVNIRTVQRWLEPPKETEDPPKPKPTPKPIRPIVPLDDWQHAQRRANDLVTAVSLLKAKSPVGTDLLIQPLKELESLVVKGSKAEATTIAANVGLDLNVAASRVRELVREFVAIKDQFEGDEQFYLDRLLGELILGEPEPPFPLKK